MNHRRLLFAALLAGGSLLIAACGTAQAEHNTIDTPPDSGSGSETHVLIDPAEPKPVDPTAPAQPEPTTPPGITLPAPHVLWLRSSHAGPGVVTLRFETDTPTTATVRVMTNQVGPDAFYTEDLDELSTQHTVSVPANAFGRYQVRVENAQGVAGWGELRYLKDAQGVDWATGANAPTLKALTAKKLEVTYGFPAGHSSKLGFDGTVRVFSTAASCTTADSCPGDLVGAPADADATGNAQLETHDTTVTIPGSGFNYQVIVGQPLNGTGSTMIFMQLEIRGDQLPKTNLQGPGSLSN